jgi:hypothetical protein
VVAESAPSLCGHKMAAKLASLGIKATLIADSAVFAMMARANKVRYPIFPFLVSTAAFLIDSSVLFVLC